MENTHDSPTQAYELPRCDDVGYDYALIAEWIEKGVLTVPADEILKVMVANGSRGVIDTPMLDGRQWVQTPCG